MIGLCLADRYDVRAVLGHGGMATVYRADDRVLGREVAIKVVSAVGLTQGAIERFQREARLVGRLDHRAVVPIYDFGHDGDQLFFVMPVLEGQTLHRLLRDRPPTLAQILEILAQVAEALDHSAGHGVVHRDIKPENVMVALDGKGSGAESVRRVWVMDFGLALGRASTRLTKTGNLPGTLVYLSPEQVLSGTLDGRSDLYSAGVILYECLFGRPPFSGAPASVLYRIVHEPPTTPDPDTVDPLLAEVLFACLEKRPQDRVQTGGELARALREVARQIDTSGAVAVGLWRRRSTGRLAQPPLIGRDDEMMVLRGSLDRSITGELQLVLVSGHPGQGKTRLLEALEDEARGRGALVLHGRYAERESTYPYQAFCELIQDFFRQLHDSHRSRGSGSGADSAPPGPVSSSASASSASNPSPAPRLPDLSDLVADLVAVFPALAEIPELRTGAEDLDEPSGIDEMARLYELIARTLGRLAGGRPALLVLEQLHAADASIGLLQYLVRRLSSAPILIAGSYRPGSVGRQHPLAGLMRGLHSDPRFRDLRLSPLPAEKHAELVAELLGAPASTELSLRLFDATEGNPFFTRELLQALLQSGDLICGDDGVFQTRKAGDSSADLLGSGELPETIQQAVEARLERLPDLPRQVLEAASVLGRRPAERDLEQLLCRDPESSGTPSPALSAFDDETFEAALDVLLELGLLEEDRIGRGDHLRFASGLVRDVVYNRLPRRRRRRFHLQHAEALERRSPKRLDRLAHELLHHYAEADVAEKVVRFGLLHARRSLDAYCWDDALYACAVAIDFAEDEGQGADEAELRRIRAHALAAKGLLEEAQREGERAFSLLHDPSGTRPHPAAPELALFLAESAWKSRRIDATRRWLEDGIQLARGVGDEARATLASLLRLAATVDNLAGESDRARRLLAEASALRDDLRPQTPPAEAPPGGTLHLAMTRSLTGLDPTDGMSAQDMEITCLLYEPLLREGTSEDFVPGLGKFWSRSDDGLVYRFHIDTERRFADGTPITAEAVKISLEAAARLAVARRPAALDSVLRIEAPSAAELELHIARPLASFPALLTDPRTAVALRPHGHPGLPVGSGPFRLRWQDEAQLILERNPEYPIAPRLDQIDIRFLPGSREVAEAWRQGGLDIARDLAPADVIDFLRHRGDGRLVETPQSNVYFVLLNPRGPNTHDPGLRRILAGYPDTRQMVWSTLPRFANPLAGWLPPGISGHDPTREADFLDLDDAVAAMDAFRPLPVRLRAIEHPSLSDQYRPVLDALCEAWSLLGIEVERDPVPIAKFADAMVDLSDVDLVFARWWPDYPDPDGFFFGAFHSAAGLFRSALANDDLDAAIDRARRHDELTQRSLLYRELEDSLLLRHLLRPLFHDIEYRLVSPRVENLKTRSGPPFANYPEVGLRQQAVAGTTTRRTGRLVIPLASRVDSLDPAWSFHADAAEVVANIFEPLTSLDDAAVAVPHLARSLEPEDGGRLWRCTLREARFHDGRRLGARDVRYSFRRLLRTGSPDLRLVLASLQGAEAAMDGRGELAGVRIVGERHLEFVLTRPVPHFPALLSNAATGIVPEGTVNFGPNWRQGTAGTGPFRLVAFEPGRRIEMVAYEEYRRPGLPRVAELVFESGIEPRRAAGGFASGEFSMLSTLAADDLEDFSRKPEFAAGLEEQPAFTTYFATLTSVGGPLADAGRRRALADLLVALRPRLAERLGRLGQAAQRLIPPSLLGLSELQQPAGGELRKSFPSIQAAQDAGSLKGVSLRVALHPSYGAGFRRLWREIRGTMETAGLRLQMEQADFPRILALASKGEVDVVFNRWIADFPDPSAFAQVIANGPVTGQWNEPELAALAQRALEEVDVRTRHRLYLEFEQMLAERSLLVPLFHEQSWRLVRPGIGGLRLRYGWPEVVYEELTVGG